VKELFQVLTVEKAREKIVQNYVFHQETESVKIAQGFGRKLAQDITVSLPVPGFNRSTVDGYAVKSADTFGASESLPALLTIVGEIPMGSKTGITLSPNEAAAIATGGMLPRNADAVVMIEYTEKIDDVTIEVSKAVAPGDNVLRKGEDFAEGDLVLSKGTRIGPFEMGLMAGTGYDTLLAERPLRVGIISTGEELVNPGEVPQIGQIRDINSYCLSGLVEQSGGNPALYGIVRDNRNELTKVLHQAVQENDLVIISGGSSIGMRDMTLEVLEEGLLFHGVAMRPGKPTLASVIDEKLVVGLPGHPASAAIAFYVLVKPLLENGCYLNTGQVIWATLSRNLASGPGREDYIRVKLASAAEGYTVATPVLGKSGLIRPLVEADGLVKIPLHKEGLSAGERVEVYLF
jgi:molybdopterin molybdotransferase